MNLFASTSSPIVNCTLAVLVLFSITTWSIILIKLYQHWRDTQDDKSFIKAFWAAKEWRGAAQASTVASATLPSETRFMLAQVQPFSAL